MCIFQTHFNIAANCNLFRVIHVAPLYVAVLTLYLRYAERTGSVKKNFKLRLYSYIEFLITVIVSIRLLSPTSWKVTLRR